ncbi:MAG: hypothetical protein PHI10_04015 [Dehalococcoidales bacterium]|nr:hypothetical protein [Dehalococcoidales bacterium]
MSEVIIGMDELEERLNRSGMTTEGLKEVLEEASSIAVKTAVMGIDGGAGIAVRSISREINPMSARVYSAMPKARQESIELGRPAGTPVEEIIGQIARWRKAVGHPEPARVIAEGIRERGVKGRFFMAAAKQKVEEDLPRLLNNMAKSIEDKF